MELNINNKNNNKSKENKENSSKIIENNHQYFNTYNKHIEDINEENNDIGSENKTIIPSHRRISIDTSRFQESQILNLNSKNIKIKIIDPKINNKKDPFFYQDINNIDQNNIINDSNNTTISINEIYIPKKMSQNKHFFACLNERNNIEKLGPILYVNPVGRRAFNPGDGESKNEFDYKNTKNKKCCGNCSACYCHLAKHQMFNCCVSENLHCCCEVVCSYLLCIFTYTLFCIFLAGRCMYALCRHR